CSALEQLRQDIKTDLFDTIYFLCADRIARKVAHQTIVVEELLKHRKQIIINGKDYVRNPENELTLTLLGAVAEYERAKITERLMRGKLHRLEYDLCRDPLLQQNDHLAIHRALQAGFIRVPRQVGVVLHKHSQHCVNTTRHSCHPHHKLQGLRIAGYLGSA